MKLATLFHVGLLVACAGACTSACGSSDPPVRRYPLRGVVTEVSGGASDRSVAIHHERIPDFEGRDGKRSEMPSMTMVFGVDGKVNAALLVPGQKLAGEFDVRWNKAPALLLVHAEALPNDTTLLLKDAH